MRAWLSALFVCVAFLVPFQTQAAEKPYWRSDLQDVSRRYETAVRREAALRVRSPADLRKEIEAAASAKDPKLTAQRLGELVGQNPNDIAAWLRLARTVLVIPSANAAERNELRDRALAAAYIAYRRGTTKEQEAEALSIIGRVYADRQLWRASLDTLKASLELREVAELRTLYNKIREEHGFRLLDYTVDSDASAPRACIQFSDPLAKRTDFSPFVSIAGMAKPAVTANDRQICVDGLKHGESYEVTVRSGVPSASGETLRRPADLVVYVRDRKPAVRFTGRAYVLPRTGQRGIPVVSINTDRVAVEVFRIGDRALVPFALDGQFRQNLEGYETNRIAQSRGARIYKGELEVKSELNKDITTAFPVNEALGQLAPGVYAMIAGLPGAGSRSEDGEDDFATRATQWFVVSDLGMTSVSSGNGLDVFVRSLGNAQPVADTDVRLVAKNNEVLATRKTDAQGFAHFENGLIKGTGGAAPAVVIAEKQPGDYAFLSLSESAFDFTDRGVGGRAAPAALDAMLFTERGVYRTGETVRLTALLRDAQARVVTGVPLTFIVTRPNGVEDRRQTITADEVGGRSMDVALLNGAMTGTWRIRAYTDPKSTPVGETAFLVEDYVPDRIEFSLKSAVAEIARGKPVQVELDGKYLFGTPTANFPLEGEIEVRTTQSRRGLQGYRFGLADDEFTTVRRPLADLPRTDTKGHANIPVELPVVANSTRPLEASVMVRMAEPGGRAVEKRVTIPVKAEAPMIGVRPLFRDRAGEGENAGFEIVLADPDGNLSARSGLKWELFRIESRYQWYRSGGSWGYEPVRSTRKIADGRVDTLATGPARISSPVTYGRYRLEVSGESGAMTSFLFDAGWAGEATADTPDRLELSLDKEQYNPGDTITVSLSPRAGGSATVMVVGDKVFARNYVQSAGANSRTTFKVGDDWGPGAYVVAFHHRPMDVAASRMPGRAVGVAWFGVSRAQRTLQVKIDAPDQIRPRSTLNVPLTITGLAAGESARVTLAAVDVGILNLTSYTPPEPSEHYLGQRRLSGEVRDLYGALIDGMQGTRGRIRSGGDEGGMQLGANPPAQAPLALYSGIVTVDAQGKANVSFDIPAFDGTARLMATAWTANKLGEGSADVIVRDPVVLTTTLPRFLAVGDRSTLRVDVNNVEGQAGEYTLDVTPNAVAELEGGARKITLAPKAGSGIVLPLVSKGAGLGNIKVRIAGPGDLAVEREYALGVRPAYPPIERRTVRTLAGNESITVGPEVFSDVVAGTGAVSLSVTPAGAIDVPSLLLSLDRYPFGCSEQVVSRAMPLLYLNELAGESQLALDKGADERIKESIARVLSRQAADGSIGLWSASMDGGTDVWLHAYVTDFLTRAREKGYHVPDGAFRQALERLRNSVNISRDLSEGGEGAAYAMYVLARNSIAPVGDIRYLADVKLDNLETTLAKSHIGAALALLGDKGRAEKVFAAAFESLPKQAVSPDGGRVDYGSDLRDGAALATLATEAGVERISRAAFQRIEAMRKVTPRASTQENVWMVLAARALARDNANVRLEIDGVEQSGPYFKTFRRADLAGKTVRIANKGDRPVQIVVGIQGPPATPEPAEEKGFKISRSYFTLDGKPADITKVSQNQRLVAVLKVTEVEQISARVVLADYLPAGFEIDNPRLVESASESLGWVGEVTETEYSEFRDERFVAAFDRRTETKPMTVAYIVRAVSPGTYVHPPAIVEDMYRPDRFARTAAGSIEVTPAGR